MTFYFPLRLGVETRLPAQDAGSDFQGQRAQHSPYDSWREGVELPGTVLEPKLEARILEQITKRQTDDTTLIVGEPGSGKTRLLEQWFRKCLENVQVHGPAALVPVFVRLRRFNDRKTQALEDALDNQNLPSLLWQQGLPETAQPGIRNLFDCGFVYQPENARYFRTLWLLDGLDEIDPVLLRNEAFFQQICQLPGHRVVTCRTATHQTLRTTEQRYLPQPLILPPLTPIEQRDFLHQLHDSEPQNNTPDPDALHREINAHSQLRPLAGNLLMLDIMGRVVGLPLPTTRYDLYERSVSRLWDKIDEPKTLVSERDSVLVQCAEETGVSAIQFPLATLEKIVGQVVSSTDVRTTLEELRRSGLVRFLDNSQCEFLHLTFQEFFLAQSLIRNLDTRPLDSLILEHWKNPRLEETLALVIDHQLRQRKEPCVLNAIDQLIHHGQDLWKNDPQKLFAIGRSPLRTALHLIQRSGADLHLRHAFLDRFLRTIDDALQPDLLKLALANDQRTPSVLLTSLAEDEDNDVRSGVAGNPSTPTETLTELANHELSYVRRHVALNPNTPTEILAKLANDEDDGVKWGVSKNPSTPTDTLAVLVDEEDGDVLLRMVKNPSTPTETLTELANHELSYVRRGVARNTGTPTEILAKLANDENRDVRWEVATNTSTPTDILAVLENDEESFVSGGVAMNASTPPETLAKLAKLYIDDHFVLRDVAMNASTPPETLTELANHGISDVRARVAANTSTPPETLAKLANDDGDYVRVSVAGNSSTPPETLDELANYELTSDHALMLESTSKSLEHLDVLIMHDITRVRTTVAANASSLLESL